MPAPRKSVFEIKIALLGNSESGKTTTLNALLRENYGGAVMSKRKAKAASASASASEGTNRPIINYNVYVSGVNENNESNTDQGEIEVVTETETLAWKDGDEEIQTQIQTVTYSIDIEKEIIPMHSQTAFSFAVIPGVVEGSGTTKCKQPYLTYVTEKWDTFDAIIVVMDGKKGISDDDVTLLKVVKENLSKREIPIILLFNKIDNAEDEKLARHVKKAQVKVEKIFSINAINSEEASTTSKNASANPSFVPCSALHAYIYRAGARLTVYQFEDFDKDLMEVIGKVHVGSKNWKKMTHEERFRKTHAILADQKQFQEVMTDCGFDKVMSVLDHFLGGAQTQERLIQQQIDLSLKKLSPFQPEWISYTVFAAYKKQIKLSERSSGSAEEALSRQSRLREAFWTTFEEYQAGTFQKFVNGFPARVHVVADPLQELVYYHKLVDLAKWEGEEEVVVDKMKAFVRRYLQFLFKHEHETNGNSSWSITSNISPIDWSVIWRSILLLSYDKSFCQAFGREQIICQALAQEANNWKANGFNGAEKNCPHCFTTLDKTKKKPFYPRCKGCCVVFMPGQAMTESFDCAYCGNCKLGGQSRQCENCKCRHEELPNMKESLKFSYSEDGILVPADADKYNKVVHLDIVESLDDPNHFGHPIYKLCNFVASLAETKTLASAEMVATEKAVANASGDE